MKEFNPSQYLAIDIANQFGNKLDKSNYETRLAWFKKNHANLEDLQNQAEEPEMYFKAVQNLRKVQNGEATGYLVGFDASNQGTQLMSILCCDEIGAENTGLFNTFNEDGSEIRPDAYGALVAPMNDYLNNNFKLDKLAEFSRKELKKAYMPHMYGSVKEPEKIFGKNPKELEAFYFAARTVAPVCEDYRSLLINMWNANATLHTWNLPDGFDVYLHSLDQFSTSFQFDSPIYGKINLNERLIRNDWRTSNKLCANVIHSIDAYICREIHRRCNYKADKTALEELLNKTNEKIFSLELDNKAETGDYSVPVSLASANDDDLFNLYGYLELVKLQEIVSEVLGNKSFEVVTIHDEYKCHAIHMNTLRFWYKEILAELCETVYANNISQQIKGDVSFDMNISREKVTLFAERIRQESNYALN